MSERKRANQRVGMATAAKRRAISCPYGGTTVMFRSDRSSS